MVTKFTEVRDYPAYDLKTVIQLAEARMVGFTSSRGQARCDSIGYSHSDVCRCLASLKPAHFRESGRYVDTPAWCDIYKITYPRPSVSSDDVGLGSQLDELYIKLRLTKGCVAVTLFSFHLDGQL